MGITVATDGSSYKGKFGWSFVVARDDGSIIGTCYGCKLTRQSWAESANVAAECTAVIEALKMVTGDNITILHDYNGVAHWASGKWKANKVCAKGYVKEFKKLNVYPHFKWTAGHSGNLLNEMADKLAKRGLDEQPDEPVVQWFEFGNKHRRI